MRLPSGMIAYLYFVAFRNLWLATAPTQLCAPYSFA